MKYLLNFEDNYCDEFDIESYVIIDQKQYKQYSQLLDTIKNNEDKKINLYFGTNEYLEYENFNDFINCITVEEITDKTAKMISTTIGEKYGLIDLWSELDFLCDTFNVEVKEIKTPKLYNLLNREFNRNIITYATLEQIQKYFNTRTDLGKITLDNCYEKLEWLVTDAYIKNLSELPIATVIDSDKDEYITLEEYFNNIDK